MNANIIDAQLGKVVDAIARAAEKLDDVDNAFDYRNHQYRYDAYIRQGARSLAGKLEDVKREVEVRGDLNAARIRLEAIAQSWDDRQDWRAAVDKARAGAAIAKVLGL